MEAPSTLVPAVGGASPVRLDDLAGALAAILAFGFATGAFAVVEARTPIPSPLVPLGVAGVGLALWRWRREGLTPLQWNRRAALAALALVVVGLSKALSGIGAVEPTAARAEALAWGKNLVVVAGLAFSVRTVRQLRWVAWGLVAALASMAVPTLVLVALDRHDDLGGYITFERWLRDGRIEWLASGPLGDANELARQMLVLVPVAAVLARWSQSAAARRLATAATVVGVVMVLVTRSRGALVALAAMAVASVVPWARRTGRLVPVLGGLLAAMVVVGAAASAAGLLKDFSEVRAYVGGDVAGDSSAAGHASTFRAGLEMWQDHPVLGVGAGNWQHHYLPLAAELGIDDTGTDRAPHNVVVELLAETGLVGLVAFALATVAVARVVGSRWRHPLGVAALGYGLAGLTQGFNNIGPLMVLISVAFISATEPAT